ncbi:MAG: putative bifunctional diguanylate cyclase/phosphodiesterase [Nitrospinales bacterium]
MRNPAKVSLKNKLKNYLESVFAEMRYDRIFKISALVSLLAGALILCLAGISVYTIYNDHMFRSAEKTAKGIRGALVEQKREMLFASGSDENILEIDAGYLPDFDRHVRAVLKSFQVVKIKIFNRDKKIIYSTEPAIVGKTVMNNDRLARALSGSLVSRLEAGAALLDLEGERRINLDVIEIYLPVKNRNGEIVGCFELYTDVTPYRQEFHRIFFSSLGLVFAVLVLVFGILNFLICRMMKTICSNTRELKTTHERIEHMALYDHLTGLPNRNLIKDRFEQMAAQAARHNKKVAVLYMDLDNFKNLNDTQGHLAGDQFLKKIAGLLKSLLRKEDSIGRLGGDEFMVLLGNLSHEDEAISLAQKIKNKAKLPFNLNGHEIYSGFSIGIAFFPNDGRDLETLSKHADIAMYRAKNKRNSFELFTASMNQKMIHRMNIEQKLRKAIATDELTLYYQPKIDLATGGVAGLEALIRWEPPNGEMIAPDQFIPIAEQSHLILSIGEWVLNSVCEQIKIWENSLNFELNVAINLSGRQFEHTDLMKIIKNTLHRTRINPRLLELEITETTIMKDTQKVVNVLRRVREMGIQSSIDDFGTGYSSLGYIRKLPVDSLKIDRTFIQNIHKKSDRAIILAVITLCRDIELKTISEGVETKEQYEFLRGTHCDQYQGYFFSPPLPTHEIEKLILSTAAIMSLTD